MKVLMIMNCFRGQAAGECYYQLARELVRAGEDVTVLLPQDTNTPGFENMDGIKVRRFDYWFPQSRSCVAYGLGIPENLRNFPLARVQFPFFLTALLARGLALAGEADVVHVITNAPGPVGALARVLWKKPFVMTYIGSDIRDAPGWLNRLLMRFCDRVISATREQTEMIQNLGRTWGLCDIKHLIEFGRFAADPRAGAEVRAEFGIEPDDFVFTFVGRIYDFKDPLTFIRAAG